MSLTSDEVNFMVYKYLLESGFSLRVYVCERVVRQSHAELPQETKIGTFSGALVAFVQRIAIFELEANLNDNGREWKKTKKRTSTRTFRC